jgi:hypothetical protein
LQSLSDQKIKSFFASIPQESKLWVKGYFNASEATIQWLYRSTSTTDMTERYEYDSVLNFNTLTGAFYPWRVSDSTVKINGILVVETLAGTVTTDNVIDGSSNNVVDSLGNQVVTYSVGGGSGVTSPQFVYIVSVPNAASHNFTFAKTLDDEYVDWASVSEVDYESYFISGYKVHGEGLRKFQSNWVTVLSRMNNPVSYYFSGLWDWALSPSTGRWSSTQYIRHTDLLHGTQRKRLKVRGHGLALQFFVQSVSGEPFDIIGWAVFETGNQLP